MGKRRTYRVGYWHKLNNKFIIEEQQAESANNIYKSLYEENHKPLAVDFIGWK